MSVRRGALPLLVIFVALGGCDGPAGSRTGPLVSADSLRIEGRFAEALPRFRALRDSLQDSSDGDLRWRVQAGWAEMLLRTGRLDSARVALDDARAMATGDRRREARTHYVRVLLLHRQGKLDSALMEAAAALEGARAVGDAELVVDAQSVHATVHSLSGRYRLAAAHAESALAGERSLRRSPQFLATRLNNLGVEYRHLARLSDAERVLLEGLALARTLPSPRVAMLLNGNMSNLRRMTGQMGEALQYGELITGYADSLSDVQGIVVGNDDIGLIHFATRNLPAARAAFQRSLDANTPTRYAYGRIEALLGLGRVEIAEGRAAAAIPHLDAAMRLADDGGFGEQRVLSRTRLAEAALAGGRPALALRWADAAVGLSDSVGDLEAQLDAVEVRAAALERLGRTAAAVADYRDAIESLESSRGRIELGDLRMSVAEPHWSVYEGAIRTSLARGDTAGAFAIAERAKARMLLELMAERDASRAQRSPVNGLKERVRVLAEERAAARTPEQRAGLDVRIAATIDSLAALEDTERDRDPAGAARYPSPAPLGALSPGLLSPDRALVTYFWGEHAVYGWRVTRGDLRAARIGSSDSVGVLVDFLRASLESSGASDWTVPARHLWTTLLGPLDVADTRELLIVPDGLLAHLPFEALLAPGDSLPLGASTRISYGPSASVLLALSRRRPEAAWPRALLAVGNPVGASLPFAELEARAAYELFLPAGADLLVGRRASLDRWLSLEPSRYRYLHIAAHAEVNDRHPEETRVLLSGGTLDLARIRALDVHADLVTLSACESALGLRVRGEGVIGLPHAFLAAGAAAVLVTLWRVDDRATALFMDEFYQELHGGAAPAEALQAVRRRWLTRSPRTHPAYWAPFILVGE
ncbi:MAG: CHAT domain-containing protein [Gemmatimonadota bacterium]|nr:CHAT domain-containing protein [Gemmatimonadota bacterium]